MARSGPVYAIALAQISADWLTYFSFTVAPSFFTSVFHMPQRYAQLVCGLPFILMIPMSVLFGRFLDILRLKRILSTVGARRLAIGIASLVPAASCLLLALMPASQTAAAVAVYVVFLLSFIGQATGWSANIADLAPQLAGATLSFTQTVSVWTGFGVPVLVDYITVHNTKEEWNIVFYVTASVQLVSFLGYCMLASGTVQPWAMSEEGPPVGDYEPIIASSSIDSS